MICRSYAHNSNNVTEPLCASGLGFDGGVCKGLTQGHELVFKDQRETTGWMKREKVPLEREIVEENVNMEYGIEIDLFRWI